MTNAELNSYLDIIMYGSLILFSFLTLSNPFKVNRKANIWFGIFLFLWSTFLLDEILPSFLLAFNTVPYITIFVKFFQFLLPAIFYFSIIFYTTPNYKFSTKDYKHILLPTIFLGILITEQFFQHAVPFSLKNTGILLLFTQAIFYTLTSMLKIRKHKKNISNFASNTKEVNLKWLAVIIYLILALTLIYTVYNILFPLSLPNTFIKICFIIVVFFIAYNSVKQKEIYPVNEKQLHELEEIQEEDELAGNEKKKLLADDELEVLKLKLKNIMATQLPFLNNELNLIELASIMDITVHQLSYVINTGFGENFYQFISKYRIEYAKKLLSDEKHNNLSILGIAFKSDFNSKTAFNTTFKKITGFTPSEFKKSSSDL